ncbi:MAG: hypothetical protein K2P78_14385 [Gemmataceae bacterium]|nr:hypothetical protein [Gemmataceae bacterium]
MTDPDPITDLLNGPLDPDWTIEDLAEKVLSAVASRPPAVADVAVVVDDATDRQPRRLIRPLLAYLATKSAAESGAPVNLYGGRLCFERRGPVWVLGEFENRPGAVRLALRRANSPPESDPAERTDSLPHGPDRSQLVGHAAVPRLSTPTSEIDDL